MELELKIKEVIIESLNLEGMTPADIDTNAPLFNEGLGLDSIDALELGLAIKNQFDVVLSSNSDENHKYFYSVATLAQFIKENGQNNG